MTDKLADFMVDLASNKGLQEAYKNSPEEAMKRHDIDDSDVQLMISKDYEAIKSRLGTDYTIAHNTITTAAKL